MINRINKEDFGYAEVITDLNYAICELDGSTINGFKIALNVLIIQPEERVREFFITLEYDGTIKQYTNLFNFNATTSLYDNMKEDLKNIHLKTSTIDKEDLELKKDILKGIDYKNGDTHFHSEKVTSY